MIQMLVFSRTSAELLTYLYSLYGHFLTLTRHLTPWSLKCFLNGCKYLLACLDLPVLADILPQATLPLCGPLTSQVPMGPMGHPTPMGFLRLRL